MTKNYVQISNEIFANLRLPSSSTNLIIEMFMVLLKGKHSIQNLKIFKKICLLPYFE
jgi:hypothetical protein